ncbi:hypothetical protein Y032_0060g3188 [Ancylostoma ceylanicum]|uniref:Uncharacterized protein n=1 Tax=Ancylostoma ceylanicum TaxID=53326 RepID=A0A016U2T0_9BILA|nr:hypothetical protein Y032_0060g3188 [Ancylostoma ceylanicum]
MRRFGSRVDASVQFPKFEVCIEELWHTMRWDSQLLLMQAKTFDRGCLRDPRRTVHRSARSPGSSGFQRHLEMHDVGRCG